MANTYDTSAFPLGSKDPRVLYNNASNFDEAVNAFVQTWVDRFGRNRKTWYGFEQQFNEFLINSGYESQHLQYVVGTPLTVQRSSQLIDYNGSVYRVKMPATFPVNLTGVWATDAPKLVDIGDASLRSLLASNTGAENVKYLPLGTDTVVQTTADLFNALKFVTKYGLTLDGETDCGPGIRRALDDLPAWGGEIQFPAGSICKVVGPIFVPQRIPTVGVAGQGVQIIGNNTTIIGDGTSNVFESGTGQFSTVSKGGATNWGLGNELGSTIHYNSRIEGFNFKTCGTAIKLFNWIQGCAVNKCYFTDFVNHALWTSRSFYLGQMDLIARRFRNETDDLKPSFRHDGFNNTMSFAGIHASGIGPDGYTHGAGILFDGGVEALTLTNGISLEGFKNGLVLKSIVYALDLAIYFELCDTAIRSIGANLNHMSIDNCRFNSCGTNLNIDNCLNGSFGVGNDAQSGTTNFGSGSTCDVWYPSQRLTPSTQNLWKRIPDNWVVAGGCKVHRNDAIFNADVGYSATLFALAEGSMGGVGVVPRHYVGSTFNVGGTTPFAEIDTSVAGTCRWKTNIYWASNLGRINFDLWVDHSQRDIFSGWTLPFNGIYAPVTVAGRTITLQQRGDFTDLVISGFGGITLAGGQIYIAG